MALFPSLLALSHRQRFFQKGPLDQDVILEILSRAKNQVVIINILGGTVSGTNRNRPWDKWDPSPGQNGTCLGTSWPFSLSNSTLKLLFCPVCPWDGWGFVPGTIVPQGPSEKCLCVFCFLAFRPNFLDPGKGGLSLRGVAVTTARAITAQTAKTIKTATVASLCCIL